MLTEEALEQLHQQAYESYTENPDEIEHAKQKITVILTSKKPDNDTTLTILIKANYLNALIALHYIY